MSPPIVVSRGTEVCRCKSSGGSMIARGPNPVAQRYRASPRRSPVGTGKSGATRSILMGELLPVTHSLKNSSSSSVFDRRAMRSRPEYPNKTIRQLLQCGDVAQADGGTYRGGG